MEAVGSVGGKISSVLHIFRVSQLNDMGCGALHVSAPGFLGQFLPEARRVQMSFCLPMPGSTNRSRRKVGLVDQMGIC